MRSKERAKLVAEMDKEQRWFQKAARGSCGSRAWVRDVRKALDIPMNFLVDELEVDRTTIYRAEEREAEGTITIEELEVLAEAMECKLVYAIVPERGTVAEAVENREKRPRRTRKEREAAYKAYVEQWEKKTGRRYPGTEGQGQGTGDAEPGKQGSGEKGAEKKEEQGPGIGAMTRVHSPGVERLRGAIGNSLAAVQRQAEEWGRRNNAR